MPAPRDYGKASRAVKISLPGSVMETLVRARWAWRRESPAAMAAELVILGMKAQGIDPWAAGAGVTEDNAPPPQVEPRRNRPGIAQGTPQRRHRGQAVNGEG